jgi:hypothetical protein
MKISTANGETSEQMAFINQSSSKDMDNIVLSVNGPIDDKQSRSQQFTSLPFRNRFPHHDIDESFLIF